MLTLVPMTITEAKAFVAQHHRHHGAPVSGLFAIAAAEGEDVRAVAIVGRPMSRVLDDGWTVEVTRLCALPGVANACSMLYAAAWRAARAMGYRKLVTYTLATEPARSAVPWNRKSVHAHEALPGAIALDFAARYGVTRWALGNALKHLLILRRKMMVIAEMAQGHAALYDRTALRPRREIRVCTYAGNTSERYGRFAWLKHEYPDLFRRLAAEFRSIGAMT